MKRMTEHRIRSDSERWTVYGVEILSGWSAPGSNPLGRVVVSDFGPAWATAGLRRRSSRAGAPASLINIPLGDELCDFVSQVKGVWAEAFTERIKKLKEVRAKIGLV